jgi:hypothetical protein
MKLRRLRAFTFLELLISMIIMGILGAVVLTSLYIFYGMFFQTRDYAGGRGDIEYVFQWLGREITNVSLGMPNNRRREGSFAEAFTGIGGSDPVMAYMGKISEDWGGPITLASFDPVSPPRSPALLGPMSSSGTMVDSPRLDLDSSGNVYVGPQLYYAWAFPFTMETSKHFIKVGNPNSSDVIITDASREAGVIEGIVSGDVSAMYWNGNSVPSLTFHFALPNAVQRLQNFTLDGQNVSLQVSNGRDVRSWVIFPTLRVPMLVRGISPGSTGTQTLALRMAPGSSTAMPLEGLLGGFEEVYGVRVARLYVDQNRRLVQEVFGSDFTDGDTSRINILAYNVAGMYFRFDVRNRLLTMYLAMRGEELDSAARGTPPAWPSFAAPFSEADKRFRIITQSMTWRIRN